MENQLAAQKHLVSIIIPVFNEERHVEEVLNGILAFKPPPGIGFELIVVDDGSWDKTSHILKNYESHPTIQIHIRSRNYGKGAAVREALKHVKGDIVLLQDADHEYSISDYPKLLEHIILGKAQVVYGSRFLGELEGMRLPNRVFNILIRMLVNVLFGSSITDEATAYKVLKTDLMRSLNLTSNRFELCPEITAKVLKRGIQIYEVPISYKARGFKEGKKIRWTDAVTAVITLIKHWAMA